MLSWEQEVEYSRHCVSKIVVCDQYQFYSGLCNPIVKTNSRGTVELLQRRSTVFCMTPSSEATNRSSTTRLQPTDCITREHCPYYHQQQFTLEMTDWKILKFDLKWKYFFRPTHSSDWVTCSHDWWSESCNNSSQASQHCVTSRRYWLLSKACLNPDGMRRSTIQMFSTNTK